MNLKATSGRGRRRKTGQPNPIDIHVGARVRLRRTLLGMSQERLGKAIGLTFQQVQKYERGANRIGSSRLFELSKILDVPVSFFFDDIDPRAVLESEALLKEAGREPHDPNDMMLAEPGARYEYEPYPMMRRETLELVRAYYR